MTFEMLFEKVIEKYDLNKSYNVTIYWKFALEGLFT